MVSHAAVLETGHGQHVRPLTAAGIEVGPRLLPGYRAARHIARDVRPGRNVAPCLVFDPDVVRQVPDGELFVPREGHRGIGCAGKGAFGPGKVLRGTGEELLYVVLREARHDAF